MDQTDRIVLVLTSLYDRLVEGIEYAIRIIFTARGADKLQIILTFDLFQSLFSKTVVIREVIFC